MLSRPIRFSLLSLSPKAVSRDPTSLTTLPNQIALLSPIAASLFSLSPISRSPPHSTLDPTSFYLPSNPIESYWSPLSRTWFPPNRVDFTPLVTPSCLDLNLTTAPLALSPSATSAARPLLSISIPYL